MSRLQRLAPPVLPWILLACGSGAPPPAEPSAPSGSAVVVALTPPSQPAQAAQPAEDADTPRVEIDGDRILLNGAPVGSVSESASAGKLQKVDALFTGLSEARERWRSAHPGEAMKGEIILRIPGSSPALVADSVILTSAFAGYPVARVDTPAGPLKLRTPVPGPPGERSAEPPPSGRLQIDVHIDASSFQFTILPVTPNPSGEPTLDTNGARQSRLSKSADAINTAVAAACRGAGDPRPCLLGARITADPGVSFDDMNHVLAALAAARRDESKDAAPELVVSLRPGVFAAGAAPARPASSPVTGAGRLDPLEIQRVVRARFGAIRGCYEEGLRRNPDLTGRVAVRFVVGRDGAVTEVSEADSKAPEIEDPFAPAPPPRAMAQRLPDDAAVKCILNAFRAMRFPPPSGGLVTVVYPIQFSPGG